MRVREWLLPGIAIVVVLALGVGLFRVATGTQAPDRHVSALEEIRALMRDRAAKLTAGDVDGYLQSVGPGAQGFEGNIARGSRNVPIVDVRITATPLRQQDVESTTFKDLPITFIYKYRDIPADNHFVYRYRSTIERKGGAWMVTGDRVGIDDYHGDRSTIPPVWASGPVQFQREGHFLAIYRPGFAHVAESVALLDQARQQLVPKVLVDFDDVHVVQLAANTAEYNQMLADIKLIGSSGVALFRFDADQVTGIKLPNNREMIVDTTGLFVPGRVASPHNSDFTPVQLMQHELGHLALFRYMTPDTPAWLNEGGAMYLSGEMRRSSWAEEVANHSLDVLSIIAIEKQQEDDPTNPIPFGFYPYCNAAVLALVQKMGPQQWFNFFKGYKRVDEFRMGLGQSKDKPTDILLQLFYKFDRGGLDDLTRAYIHAAVGR